MNVSAPALAGPLHGASLVIRAQAGDQLAFTRLIDERHQSLYRTAWAILRNHEDALDATQDTCLGAWRELPRLRDPARFDAWLTRSLVNRCRTALRSRKRVSVREIQIDTAGGHEMASGEREVGDSLAVNEAIRRAFARLNAEHRTYLVLHYVEHRPIAEIAVIVDAPRGNGQVAALGSSPRAREPTGTGGHMSTFVLTDAAIERALAPDVQVAAPADFTTQIAQRIALHPRRSRWLLLNPAAWPRQVPLVTQLVLLLLLLLVLVLGAVAVGSLTRRALANGDVIVSTTDGLVDIDPKTGTTTSLLSGPGIFGVTRSDDGSQISFWTKTGEQTTLEVIAGNGGGRRRLAANLIPSPVGQGQVDVWSPNGRALAAGVIANGEQRILLVDVSSGVGELIGPSGASNPLWSPDGHLLAFSYSRDARGVLAVMRPDGSELREVSGDLGGFDVSGANNWSPDGVWVYFGGERNSFNTSQIYRARVDAGYSEKLTNDILSAAPALSPDGTTVAYSFWRGGLGTQDLKVMDADGGNQRLVLASAINDGWSNDGQFLLAEWRPGSVAYELVTLRPDGTDRRTLMTFDSGCASVCAQNVAWGQPRP